jgi:hypothetical protein
MSAGAWAQEWIYQMLDAGIFSALLLLLFGSIYSGLSF